MVKDCLQRESAQKYVLLCFYRQMYSTCGQRVIWEMMEERKRCRGTSSSRHVYVPHGSCSPQSYEEFVRPGLDVSLRGAIRKGLSSFLMLAMRMLGMVAIAWYFLNAIQHFWKDRDSGYDGDYRFPKNLSM